MLLKMQILSHNSWMALPEDMDFSDTCDECGSDNLKSISEEEGLEKIKSKASQCKIPSSQYASIIWYKEALPFCKKLGNGFGALATAKTIISCLPVSRTKAGGIN